MLILHLLLLIASFYCLSSGPVVTPTLELSAKAKDDKFHRYAHSELAIYMCSIGVNEYFVSKDLIIDGTSYGPCYLNLKPRNDGDETLHIDKLDFGEVPIFKGLEPHSKENRLDVINMFIVLIKPKVFDTMRKRIVIYNVFVNRINYGVCVVPDNNIVDYKEMKVISFK